MRRIATLGQTIALIARDHGCSFPGCDHPPNGANATTSGPGSTAAKPTWTTSPCCAATTTTTSPPAAGPADSTPTDSPNGRHPQIVDRHQRPMINNRITGALAARTFRMRT